MKKILSALMLCFVSIVLTSCGNSNSTTSTQNVNVTAAQADVWQSIGSVSCYSGAYITDQSSAQLYVKNVYGVNYYKIKINGGEYGVEDNPYFGDFEQRSGKGRDAHKYKHKAGSYYLNLPGEDVSGELRRIQENSWTKVRTIKAHKQVYNSNMPDGITSVTEMQLYKKEANGTIQYKIKNDYNGEEYLVERYTHICGGGPWAEEFQYKAGPYSLNLQILKADGIAPIGFLFHPHYPS